VGNYKQLQEIMGAIKKIQNVLLVERLSSGFGHTA
jgi:hypothetical protein